MASTQTQAFEFVGIGFGPMHLALACLFHERQVPARFLERRASFSWHAGLQFADSLMQTPFLKDLASMRDPRSEFTFVNYLKEHGRLEAFIDNRILYPTRAEYEDYLQWAARKTAGLVEYESAVELVEPVVDAVGQLVAFRVITRDGRVLRCTSLSIAAGLDAAAGAKQGRVLPVPEYEYRVDALLRDAPRVPSVLVVGAGQSAAEVVLDLLRRNANVYVTVASRGFVFRTVEANPFVNGLFCERAQRKFARLPLATREKIVRDLRLSNYGAVDEQVLTAISRLEYDESVRRGARLTRQSYTEVLALDDDAGMAAATLRDLHSGAETIGRYDFAVDCRGFGARQATRLLEPLMPFLPAAQLAQLDLDVDYAVKGLRTSSCRLYLHGYATYLVDTTMICNIAQRSEAMGSRLHG